MRARHRQHPLPAQHVFRQPLRAGGVRQSAIEYFFHQRIAARDHVADHANIGIQIELIDAVTFDEFDALCRELRAHRRIHIGVATGDLVSGSARDGRDAAHEGAANAEDVNVHDVAGEYLKGGEW